MTAAPHPTPSVLTQILPGARRPLRVDQERAVGAAARQLRRPGSRATVVSACGTGKTLIGIRMSEEVDARLVLVVLPTKDLAAQTALAWRADGRMEPMVIVSSMDASAREDLAVFNIGSTGRPAALAAVMATHPRMTVFVLYDSLGKIIDAQRNFCAPAFDLAILDEAHRISGHEDKKWAKALDNDLVRADRRLFLTATPRIWASPDLAEDPDANPRRPRRRRTTPTPRNLRLLNSLDNPHLYGPQVHTYQLHQAVDDGVLADYRILIPTITDTDLQRRLHHDTSAHTSTSPDSALRTTALHLAVLKAMTDHQLHHVIVYFNEVAAAADFTRELPHTLRTLPADLRPTITPKVLHINGDALPDERRETLYAFETAETAILTNAKVLTEGIDIGAVDGIVIADPTRSIIRCVQALGRALRKPAGADKLAHLVIPVYIPNGTDPTDILGTPYEPVWAIATALRSHDHRIADRLPNRSNRLPGETRELIGRRWRFDYDTRPEAIARAMDLLSFDPVQITTRPRLKGLASAQAYRDEFGHLAVPHDYTDPYGYALGVFLTGQRTAYHKGELPKEWIAELDALGMVWSVPDAAWQTNLTVVENYHREMGHLAIPAAEPGGRFLVEQRSKATRGELPAERAADLDRVDPGWRLPHGPDWHRKYGTLRTHLRVGNDPAELHLDTVINGVKVGPWLQRQLASWTTLHPDQRTLIAKIGLTPENNPGKPSVRTRRTFRQNAAILELFLARENGRPPHSRTEILVDGEKVAIGAWLAKARTKARSGDLPPEDHTLMVSILGEDWTTTPGSDG